jgi:hypothetical protein
MSEPLETKQPAIIAITLLFPAVSAIILGLRLWQRFLINQFNWGKATRRYIQYTQNMANKQFQTMASSA